MNFILYCKLYLKDTKNQIFSLYITYLISVMKEHQLF